MTTLNGFLNYLEQTLSAEDFNRIQAQFDAYALTSSENIKIELGMTWDTDGEREFAPEDLCPLDKDLMEAFKFAAVTEQGAEATEVTWTLTRDDEQNLQLDCWYNNDKNFPDSWGEAVAETLNDGVLKDRAQAEWTVFDSDSIATCVGFYIEMLSPDDPAPATLDSLPTSAIGA